MHPCARSAIVHHTHVLQGIREVIQVQSLPNQSKRIPEWVAAVKSASQHYDNSSDESSDSDTPDESSEDEHTPRDPRDNMRTHEAGPAPLTPAQARREREAAAAAAALDGVASDDSTDDDDDAVPNDME